MPFPATPTAGHPPAVALNASQPLTELVASLWLTVQATAQNILRPSGHSLAKPALTSGPDTAEILGGSPEAPPPTQADPRFVVPGFVTHYARTLDSVWCNHDWADVVRLVETLQHCWREHRQVFLCGNGGSAANAIHLANDLLYGVNKASGRGLRVVALPANPAVLTCLANDLSYDEIFAQQLSVLARPGDVLLVLSGSGNSPNIVRVLERARELHVTSFAILGFTGGRALELADHPIYFPVHDMQVAEDLQMMVGHMTMQALARNARQ